MFQLIFTAALLSLLTLALILEFTRPVYLLLTALIAFIVAGILPIEQAFSGFSNQGMLTIAVLYIVAATLQGNETFSRLTGLLLRKGQSVFLYLRFMIPVSFLSAFINNTPLVATLIPQLKNWSKKNDFPLSKLLIPLSYAAILGGMCTLIGSSTNLIVHGMLLDYSREGFGFFEIGKIGLPVALASIIYFALVGHRLLPVRKSMLNLLSESSREFVAELKVEKGCPHIGKTILEANLRHLKGLYLFQIERGKEEITPLSPNEVLQTNDRLFFTGLPDTIYDLVKTPGFSLVKDAEFDLRNIDSDRHQSYEVVISNTSPLAGMTVRDSNFRGKYNAVILAIHRNGHRIKSKVGDIVLQANDTLFILAQRDFGQKWYNSSDFSLVSESIREYSKPQRKGNMAFILIGLMVLAVATGLIPSMLLAASITAGALILLRVISYRDAKKSVDLDVLLTIAAALGIGKAIGNSGLAEVIATYFIHLVKPLGPLGIIGGIFILTSIYTEIITNNASAAILFPFVLGVAEKLDMPLHPLMLVLVIAASGSFSTPIGYQTNLMVYSAGGYRFSDFLKTGLPLNLLVGVITTFMVWKIYFLDF